MTQPGRATSQVVPVDAGTPAPADGYWSPHPPLAVTTDLVVFAVAPRPEGHGGRLHPDDRARARSEARARARRTALKVATVRRAEDPYRGRPALPGGFVRHAYPGASGTTDPTLLEAAERELFEESGLRAEPGQVKIHSQVGAFGDAGRDSRLRVVTVAYLATMRTPALLRPGGDAVEAVWLPVRDLLEGRPERLAFDHTRILEAALERLQGLVEETQVAMDFVGEVFTVPELHWVYEAVFDRPLDPGNFHRKLTGRGFVVQVDEQTAYAAEQPPGTRAQGRRWERASTAPAAAPETSPETRPAESSLSQGRAGLYVAGPNDRLYPPIRPRGVSPRPSTAGSGGP